MSAWHHIVSEAHRRSLWQVLGIYLMGSWIGFQVVLGLVEGIGLPSWLPGLAAALFVIGLHERRGQHDRQQLAQLQPDR